MFWLTPVFLFMAAASASPMPGMSSSLLVSQKPGIFRSVKGFTVNSGSTEWILGDTPADLPSVETLYRSPETHRGMQPVLTVRVDELSHKMDLKTYVKQWMKDYTLLGFNVLKAATMKVNSQPAFVVDVDEAKGEKRLRQVVFVKDRTAVVLTCRDLRDSFSKTVKQCNEIFKSFEWNPLPAPSGQTGV